MGMRWAAARAGLIVLSSLVSCRLQAVQFSQLAQGIFDVVVRFEQMS